MAKLIVENANVDEFEFLTESNDKSKPPTYILRGIYAQSQAKNGNGRVYPYEELKAEIDRFDREFIQTGRALGELEHPDYPEINPVESAIRILSLKEDNKSWIGESCILASQPEYGIRGTPKGDILLSLVQYGTKVGFSTRAVGEVNDDGIVTEMKLCTIDCVANPSIGQFCESNGDRFVNGILESKNFIINTHGEILEAKYSKLEDSLKKMPNTFISSKKAEHLGNAFHEFLESLI